jgi:hypothetical protein
MRIFVAILFTLLITCGVTVYADEHNGYATGYSEGYQRGWHDQDGRVTFDFHGPDYSATSDCDFRSGYVEGYADGYFRRPSAERTGTNYNYSNNNYDHDRDYDRDDHRASDTYGGGEVIAFADTGFHGSARAFPPGQYSELKDGWDDKIESIQVNGPVRIVLFDKKDFKGESITVTQNAPDLGDFRKKAASMVIEPLNYR